MSGRNPIRTFYAYVRKAEVILAGICLLLMVCLIFTSGVARTAGHPLNWTVEVSACLFAWGCFLSADIAWRKDGLMSIDFLLNYLPPVGRRVVMGLNYVIISAFLAYVIVFGTWLAWVTRARHFTGIPELSYAWVTMSFPVAAALMLITALLKLRGVLIEAFEAARGPERRPRARLRRVQGE